MAGKFGSPSVFVLVDGYNLTAHKIKTFSKKFEAIQERSDGLGDSSEASTPVGMSRMTIQTGGGFYDTSTANSHAALAGSVPSSPQSTRRIACCGFSGQTIGEMFYGFEGVYSNVYEVMAENGLLTKANATYVMSGQLDRGVILQHLTAKTADWNTKTLGTEVDYTLDTQQTVVPITSNSAANPSVVTTPQPHGLTSGDTILIAGVSGSSADINGQRVATVISTTTFSVPVNATGSGGTGGTFVRANSSNGGVGYLEVTAFSGFSGAVIKIRDSADNSTFADLLSFANVTTAPIAERVAVSGVVDRYLSVDSDVTGSGSITAFVGFARTPA